MSAPNSNWKPYLFRIGHNPKVACAQINLGGYGVIRTDLGLTNIGEVDFSSGTVFRYSGQVCFAGKD